MAGTAGTFFRQQFPALAWAAVIFLLSSIPANKLPDMKIFSIDKFAHIFVFFVLGLLVYRGLRRPSEPAGFSLPRMGLAFALVMAYGILDELHQGLVPGRSLDVYDALADAAGGLLAGLTLFFYFRRLRRKRVAVTE
jgi:VanZ family protein